MPERFAQQEMKISNLIRLALEGSFCSTKVRERMFISPLAVQRQAFHERNARKRRVGLLRRGRVRARGCKISAGDRDSCKQLLNSSLSGCRVGNKTQGCFSIPLRLVHTSGSQ